MEIGVANGHSTFITLSALARNGKGKLDSIGISPNVSSLLAEDLKRNWELIVLPKASKKALDNALKSLDPIDIFIHDSNHLYYWQEVEYNTAFKYVKSQGFIMSDDVDFSYAFLDFIRDKSLDAYFLYDTRKIFGITRKKWLITSLMSFFEFAERMIKLTVYCLTLIRGIPFTNRLLLLI